MNIRDLFKELKLPTRAIGEKIGLSGSQVSLIANGKSKISGTVKMVCRYRFWKELGLDREEILKELGLEDPNPAPLFINDSGSEYLPSSKREKQLIKMVDQLNRDNRVLMATLENLNKQLEE